LVCNSAVRPALAFFLLFALSAFAANVGVNVQVYDPAWIVPSPLASTTDTLQGFCNMSLAGGNPLAYDYAWYVDGTLNSSGSSGPHAPGIAVNVANITPASLALGQEWIIGCRASDGLANSSWVNSTNTTITSAAPVITAVYPKASEDPEPCANTPVGPLLFNVTHPAGRANINLSATYVNFTNGNATRRAAACADAGGSGTDMTINCTGAEFQYWDAPGTWGITAYVQDNEGNNDANGPTNMSYNSGIYMAINNGPISFGAVAQGTFDNPGTNSPAVNLENCGNVKLNMSITGSNITDYTGTLAAAVGNFKIGESTDPAGALVLSYSAQEFQPTGGLNVSSGTSATWDIYAFVTIPSTQPAGVYSNGTWRLIPSEA